MTLLSITGEEIIIMRYFICIALCIQSMSCGIILIEAICEVPTYINRSLFNIIYNTSYMFFLGFLLMFITKIRGNNE